jgi:hypothetical protein
MKNGDTVIHNAWGVEPVTLDNVEDGTWRSFSVEWNASTKKVSVHLAGVTRFSEVTVDLADHFSASNGSVYWGFTAATGGAGR